MIRQPNEIGEPPRRQGQETGTWKEISSWQETLWLLIAVLTPLFVNFWVEQQFEASKIWLLRSLSWLLAVLWLRGRLAGLRHRPLSVPVRNLSILLVLVLGLATLLSTDRTIALVGSLERANGFLTQGSYLLLFWCVATRIDPSRSERLLRVVVMTAVPICLLGLAQAAGWQPLPVLTDARSPLTTTLGRANFTGAYLALLLPLTLAASQMAQARWQRSGIAALLLLEVAVIGLTRARAAWIAAAVGCGVLLWLHVAPYWSRRARGLSALGGLGALSGALLLILQRGIAGGGSIAARWTIWQASVRLLWPRLWLGYGADTLELHFPAVYPPQLVYYQGRGVVVDRAHNWLLDWSLSYGIVATLLLIGLIGFILGAAWKGLSSGGGADRPVAQEPPLDRRWLKACMAALCAQLVGNLFLFDVAATAVLFWLLLAILTAATAAGRPQVAPLSTRPWVRNAILVTAVIGAGWGIWLSNVRPLSADVHSWRGTQALGQGNSAVALREYRAAVARQPRRAAYHVAVGLTAAQLGDFEQAERAMQEAIALRPGDPVLYTQLAAVFARAATTATPEKSAEAYDAYEQAIARGPTIALTYQQYADFALRLGDGETALRQAQQAVDLDATDGISFGISGWAQLQNGNPAAAQAAFEQAVRWQPEAADFHLGLATAYFQQGRFVSARQAVQRALMLDPANAPALALQAQLPEE